MSFESCRVQLSVCEVDMEQGLVFRDGESTELTNQELELLAYLVQHSNEVLSRDQLLRDVWGQQNPGMSRAVDMTVRRLRKKIEANAKRPDHIQTVRGAGYRFGYEERASSAPSEPTLSDSHSTLAGSEEAVHENLGEHLPHPFGRYLLLDLLGEGGFAQVYRAEMQGVSGFRKTVAVKVMKATNAKAAAELVHEGRLGGLLKHRNVVDTYELGVVSGRGYVAMEWVDGLSLRELIRAAVPPASVVTEVALAICRGLTYAHGLPVSDGVLELVHLDLKPANVLVGWDGSVKVADFGIARLSDGRGRKVLGTPAYMSPEQALGQPVDARADVFSFGILLYEMVMGQRLFSGVEVESGQDQAAQMEAALVGGQWQAEVEQRVPGLGPVVAGCLRVNLEERTGSVSDVAQALRHVQSTQPKGPNLESWLADALDSRERQVVADAKEWARLTPAVEETLSWDTLDGVAEEGAEDDGGHSAFSDCLVRVERSAGVVAVAEAIAKAEASMDLLTGEARREAPEALELAMEAAGVRCLVAGHAPTLVIDGTEGVCFVGGRNPIRFRPNSVAARLFVSIATQEGSLSEESLYSSVWDEPFRNPSSVHALRKEVMDLQGVLARSGLAIERKQAGGYALTGGSRVVRVDAGQTDTVVEKAAPARTNLVREHNLFVGRVNDLMSLAKLFDSGKRLVTIVGPPGTGKTRLMKRFGSQSLHQEQVESVWFCDLTETRTEQEVLVAISRVLTVPLNTRDEGLETLVQRIGDALSRRGTILLLLDNAEQVVGELAPALRRWWERASDARFVVTSRLPLRLQMEQRMPLAPLTLPLESSNENALTNNPAVALFVDRARAVQPGFVLDSENVEAVAELVRELDGLPLAIELAAARVHMWAPEMLLTQLSKRFRLLARPSTSGPRRQATLRGALDWSWELLQPWEQAALSQCSVFREGFTWRAVEAVLDLSDFPQAPWSVDVVQMLLEHSLVVSSQTPLGVRLSLLKSVAAYADEKLTPPHREMAQRRHAGHYQTFGSEAFRDSLARTGGDIRRKQLTQELANLRIATERALDNGWHEEAIRCSLAASKIFGHTGPYSMGLRMTARVLEHVPQTLQSRWHLLHAHSQFLFASGKMEEACKCLQETLAGVREHQDRRAEARALFSLLGVYNNLGRWTEGMAYGEEALRLFRALNFKDGVADVLINLGVNLRRRGRNVEAQKLYEEALHLYRELGDSLSVGIVLNNLGNVHLTAKRLTEAMNCFDEALVIHRDMGNRISEGRVLVHKGRLLKKRGQYESAEVLLEQALAILVEVGDAFWQAFVCSEFGHLCYELGRWVESESHHLQALAINKEIGAKGQECNELFRLGLACRAQGRLEDAAAWYAQSLAVAMKLEGCAYEAKVRNALGELGIERALLDEARSEFDKALSIYVELSDEVPTARVLFNLARLCLLEGGEQQAEVHMNKGLLVLARATDLSEAATCLEAAANLVEDLASGPQAAMRREFDQLRKALEGGG